MGARATGRRGVACLLVTVLVGSCTSSGPEAKDGATAASVGEAPVPREDAVDVDDAGWSGRLEGVQVVVPAGAVPEGRVAQVGTADAPPVDAGERIGPVAAVLHDGFDLAVPLEVTWDISALSDVERATVTPVHWSEADGAWEPASALGAEVEVDGDELVVRTTEWDFWSWIANTGQTVGELTGSRKDAPSCSDASLPAWATGVLEPDLGTNAAPVRTCVEGDGDEAVTWRVTNNRTFSQRLVIDEGVEDFAWTWRGEEKPGDLANALHAIAHDLSDGDGLFLLPPLTETAVGVGRPVEPGRQTIALRARVDAVTVLTDVVVYGLQKVGIDGAFDDPGVNLVVTTLYECGAKALLGRPSATDLLPVVVDVLGSCATTLVEGPVADQLEQLVRSGSVSWRLHRRATDIAEYFRVLEAGKLVFYLSDQLQNAIVGEFTFGHVALGQPPVLGGFTPSCDDVAADVSSLYRNLTQQDAFAPHTDDELSLVDGWQEAAEVAVEPFVACPAAHAQAVVDALPRRWGDTAAAEVVAVALATLLGLDPPATGESPSTGPATGAVGGGVTSVYSDAYRAEVTDAVVDGYELVVTVDATGERDLRRPETSCVRITDSTGTTWVARPSGMQLDLDEPGHHRGTLTFPALVSGSYAFNYSCRADYTSPVLGSVTVPSVTISRYSAEYYAVVLAQDGPTLTFRSHGRTDLRRPETSCLVGADGSTVDDPALELAVDVQFAASQTYGGVLRFRSVPAGAGFLYSCRTDYTTAPL